MTARQAELLQPGQSGKAASCRWPQRRQFDGLPPPCCRLCRERAGTEHKIETAREWQRRSLEEERDIYLEKLRGWVQRGYETLQ